MWSSKLIARFGFAALLLTGGVSAPSLAQAKKDKKGEKKETPAPVAENTCKEGSTNIGCKKETKEETKIEAVKSTRLAPGKPQKAAPINSDEFGARSSLVLRSEAKLKEALGYLDELIKTTDKGDPEMPDLLYQYGEALYEQSKNANNKARALDDKLYDARQKNDQAIVDKIIKEQTGYEKKASDNRLDAFKKYKKVIDDYPSYPKRDEVLFFTGYNLKELAAEFKLKAEVLRDQGNTSEAESLDAKAKTYGDTTRSFYKTLLKEYPSSKFVPDALFEFAEFYFYDNDMDTALRAYEKLAAYPDSRIYGYSVYKQGWCYFNLGEYQEAIKKFVEVVGYSRAASVSKDKAKVTLEKEALKDIVRTYAKFGAPDKARSFFQKVGGEDKFKDMMGQLGGFYYEQGQYLDAIDVYEEVIDIDPKSDGNYKYQYEICLAAMSLATQNQVGAKERIVTEMQTLSKMYQDLVARKAPEDKVRDAKELTAQILKEVAVNWHIEAQKTKSKEQYQRAQYIYKEYIASFPDAEDIYVMTWNYGELLFQLEQWGEAGEIYQRVVEMDPKGKYLEQAALAAVISFRNSSLGEITTPPANPGGAVVASGPKEIPDRDKKMLKAYDFYTKYAPSGDKFTTCEFEIGRIYWSYQHYDEAYPHIKNIVDNHSKDPTASYAANIFLDILKNSNRSDEFKTYVFKFRADPSYASNPEIADDIENNYLYFRSKECDDAYKAEKWADSAGCYEALTELNIQPESKRGAIYNAAIAFENARQIGRAIQYRTLLTEDPAYSIGSDGKPTRESQLSAYALGLLFMNIGSYKRACEYFEQFGAKFQGEPNALDALNNAAIFREGLREYDKAVEDNRAYIGAAKGQLEKAQKSGLSEAQKEELRKAGRAETTEEFVAKKKIEIASAFFRITKIREREGVPAKTKGAYEEYLKSYGKDGNLDDVLAAKGWLASNLWREGKRDETVKRCKEIIDAVDGLGTEKASKELSAGIDAAAECSFYVAERGYEIFESFKLPNNFDIEKIGEWVDGMKKSRENTSVLYQKVLNYGSKGWSLAALARIGEMSYRFMDGLYKAPLPEVVVLDINGDGKPEKVKLTKAQREKVGDDVRSKLDTVAEPLRGDAIIAFDRCIKGATQNKWFNEWSQKCEEYLNKLSPSEYPLSAEWKSDPYKDELITVPAAVVTVLK